MYSWKHDVFAVRAVSLRYLVVFLLPSVSLLVRCGVFLLVAASIWESDFQAFQKGHHFPLWSLSSNLKCETTPKANRTFVIRAANALLTTLLSRLTHVYSLTIVLRRLRMHTAKDTNRKNLSRRKILLVKWRGSSGDLCASICAFPVCVSLF